MACVFCSDSFPGEPLSDDRVALIKQIKEANDIVDVVGGYVALRPAGQTFKGLCPFHEDRRPSFDVDPRRQRYRCWSCDKYGDVIQFVQEFERVDFPEALELLARRAGIPLKKSGDPQQQRSRALMFEVMRWSADLFQQCLLDDPVAEPARVYLEERKLTLETVRRFGLGFAPPSGEWLVRQAEHDGFSTDLLEKVGLIARRNEGRGYYDRFRNRVMFPIRDARGQTVGFGGRILPNDPLAARLPKYYNSSDTPLFSKSENLYGIDQARQAAAAAGYLAVVEGYTDVLMAQQMGVGQVVATMGTALNAKHIHQLRRFAPRVVLVFDADAGGEAALDRALELFVSHDLDLKVAALPRGLDPCDLLVAQGAGPFLEALVNATDVLDFKLKRVWDAEADDGVEGRRRAADAVLGVIALAPESADAGSKLKRDLMLNRIARRLLIDEQLVRERLGELRARRQAALDEAPADAPPERKSPAAPVERELLEVLLAEPALVPEAQAEIHPSQVNHLGLRQLLEGLYRLQAEGVPPELDRLRPRIENPRLASHALRMQEDGRNFADRPALLKDILARFRENRERPQKRELQNRLHAAQDHTEAVELLRRLQNRMTPPDAPSGAGS
jgi:DNA primase